LKLNVEFTSTDSGDEAKRTGRTRNVSAGGIYFVTAHKETLKPGQKVSLQLSGFSQYNAGPIFRSLSGRATVLRMDQPKEMVDYEKVGVAVRFDERPKVSLYRMSA